MSTDSVRFVSRPRFHCQGPAAAGYTSSACCGLVWPQKPAAPSTVVSTQHWLLHRTSENFVLSASSSLASYFHCRVEITRSPHKNGVWLKSERDDYAFLLKMFRVAGDEEYERIRPY